MYAIVDIAGQQFKVEKNQKLFVHRLEGDEGSKVTFEKVYLIDNEKNISVGDPIVKGASVSAKILSHLKGDKVLVFKKKRRKGYKKLTGHRQFLTQIQIEGIAEKSSKPAAAAKAEPAKKAEATEKKTAPKTAAAEKKAAPKKTTTATKKTPTAAKKKEEPKKTTAATEKKAAPAKKPATAKTTEKKSAAGPKNDDSSDKATDKA